MILFLVYLSIGLALTLVAVAAFVQLLEAFIVWWKAHR